MSKILHPYPKKAKNEDFSEDQVLNKYKIPPKKLRKTTREKKSEKRKLKKSIKNLLNEVYPTPALHAS